MQSYLVVKTIRDSHSKNSKLLPNQLPKSSHEERSRGVDVNWRGGDDEEKEEEEIVRA